MSAEFSPELYRELRRIAGYWMRQERLDHTLQPTAVVHEAWLRFGAHHKFESRAQFVSFATKVIREVLCDYARAHGAQKRGRGRVVRLTDNDGDIPAPDATGILELNSALDELQGVSERAAKVVELKYFGQLKAEEIAPLLDVSERTVTRDWEFAKAWLQARLGEAQR
ncbi:MAG TPA: ECF-type sigma factor [Bryobacteraceae bacterium]|nr:ECF-type sigma factor [Bryobacteraceae bacterium]